MPSITIGSTSYDYNSQARAIGGSLPNYFNPALSFTIEEISDSKWSLRINRTDLVGLFDSRDYALGILIGLYTSHDGHEDSFSIWMNDSLTNRGSTITSTFTSIYDVTRFITVPNQVTTSSTFTVEFVAEMVDPSESVSAPSVNGTTATQVNLVYPTKGGTSTQVWRANVPVSLGENTLTIDGSSVSCRVVRKNVLSTVNVASDTELRSALETAAKNTTTDEIVVNYTVSNLAAVFQTGWTLQKSTVDASLRDTWITLKAGTGSIGWDRNSGTTLRPNLNYLCIDGASIGSSSDDELGGMYYLEDDYNIWLKDCTETYQYDFSYTSSGGTLTGKDARLPSGTLVPVVRNPITATTNVYRTGGSITGSASLRSSWRLLRDVTFNQVRSDMCANTTAMVNVYVQSCTPVTVNDGSDTTHLDLLQFWGDGSTGGFSGMDTQNIVGAGLYVDNAGTLPTEIQTWLFDRTYGSTRTKLVLKDITSKSQDNTNNFCQFAGNLTDILIKGISLDTNGFFSYRSNFTGAGETAFNPSNMFIKDTDIDKHNFGLTGGDTVIDYDDVSNTNDITTELNAVVTANSEISGLSFVTPHVITAAPATGSFSDYKTGNPRWRTDSGGTFVNTLNLTDHIRLRVYDASSTFGIFIDFTDATALSNAITATSGHTFTLVVTPTDGTNGNSPFTYTWNRDINNFTGGSGNLPRADATGSTWPASGSNAWGDNPTYSFTSSA